MALVRCTWPDLADPVMVKYHDEEWGTPVRDDRKLFEFLVLDTFQAGLSWRTILHKRAAFDAAFVHFEPEIVAGFGPADVGRLMADAGIVRNRQKIEAAITNAQLVAQLQADHGSLGTYLWSFVDGRPLVHAYGQDSEIRPTSPEGDAMSRELRRMGFKFVGPTVCYAFTQGAGLVNDHLVPCFRYEELTRA